MPIAEGNQTEVIEIEQEIGSVLVLEHEEIVIEEVGIDILEISESGAAGPPGPDGTVNDFEQTFSESMEWIVNHNLGRNPSVTLTNSGGAVIAGNIVNSSINQLTVYWALPTAGNIRCV